MNQSGTEKATAEAATLSPARLAYDLAWLLEAGVDEILHDQPLNRLQAPAPAETERVPERAARVAVPERVRASPVPAGDSTASKWSSKLSFEESLALAEQQAQACTDLAALQAALESFDAHPLKKTATRTCFLGGAKTSHVLLLSDKPRNDEDASGEVLAGKHQVLAERMLAAIGLSGVEPRTGFRQVMLANMLPWRPPGNRAATEQEMQLLLPFVRRLVALAKPQAILCFGTLAGQWLAGGDEAMMRARGKWLSLDSEGRSIPLLATFHPEALLKAPQMKRLAWADLQSFRDRLAGA